ncbi:hypothetical protein UR09_02105 [Candidatus Nitromaritima sp. SCGC AAA799-A02]|nr:hypothetical protein UZ36_04635 [Candidatus Nitromaritima sp. SCGC AAA799-C22]KMP11989.1 hypothetical protein UR09_02105 [Candidatus Nitromaritima sp. SCGC AAA799-A02]
MTIKSILKKLAMLLFVALGYGAYYGWQQTRPVLDELREKDPEKFDLMVQKAKAVHIKEAKKLFDELDAMTQRDVVYLRYKKWQEKRKADKDFKLSDLEEKLEQREKAGEERKNKHELELRALAVRVDKKGKIQHVEWKKAEPWQKSIVLREKCIKYLKMEEMDSRRRKNARELSRISSILERPKKTSWSIPEYCMNAIPTTHSEEIVRRAVQRLRGEMNYYYYVRLLNEIGVPEETLKFHKKLEGMSGYFTDS